ncbi:microcystin-dependent protein [Inhella inkyongensis]|uniref:Microcystin-dependent protein n=1 Tax=Inhella inkyongensis TaxID=392593 RepID=A0A840SDM1_9BURK|nr:tail fiber protein [Inhella inkyongensis]MBB5206389.1 microcystin-dependent protein [Inhella inkyongensis]
MKTNALRALVLCGLGLGTTLPSLACSGEPVMGMICTTAANFCPRGTLEANGALLAIAQNTALFSLLGTNYGGDGRVTFGLPDLRGRSMVGAGMGPGLTPMTQGEASGSENITLTLNQMPMHTHTAVQRGTASAGNTDSPSGAVPAKLARSNNYSSGAADANMGANSITVGAAGGSQPVAIRNPYLVLKHCVVSEGIYPSRP